MTDKIPLRKQVDDGVAILKTAMETTRMVVPAIKPSIDALCLTLEWMKKNEPTLRRAIAIEADERLKAAALEAFPGAEVMGGDE